ncbi:MAG: PadR family transcriptional regulator [Gemmatimonadaceae bacterium]
MRRRSTLSLADLVVLSLLAEGPTHGYDLWAELLRRHVWKWAAISRPQVYYSLKKLEAAGHLEPTVSGDATLGPERRTLVPTPQGRRALSDALARAEWATQRPPPPFLTWMVLSWQARPRDFASQIERRRRFLREQLDEDRAALDAVTIETSSSSDAAMIVRLGLRQFETELAWLDDVSRRHRPG